MTREPTEAEAKCLRAINRHIERATHQAGLMEMADGTRAVRQSIGDPWQIAVRAVIRALRDPTPEMAQAMSAALDAFGTAAAFGPGEVGAVWRAGIDAASPPEDA